MCAMHIATILMFSMLGHPADSGPIAISMSGSDGQNEARFSGMETTGTDGSLKIDDVKLKINGLTLKFDATTARAVVSPDGTTIHAYLFYKRVNETEYSAIIWRDHPRVGSAGVVSCTVKNDVRNPLSFSLWVMPSPM